MSKETLKKEQSKDKKSGKKTIIVIAIIGWAATLVLVALLLIPNIDKTIARYDTLDQVRATVQNGIPTTCTFKFTNHENDYMGDDIDHVISIDADRHLLKDFATRYLNDGSDSTTTYLSLYRDGYVYNQQTDGDDATASKVEFDSNDFIDLYMKTFLDVASSSSYYYKAYDFNCQPAVDADFAIPEDVEFIDLTKDESVAK
ncbi:hypothetical protein FWF89_01045 [Candidatus Saccharibacteria bacterium]|nr:hypothetical protein [Candidatus Saccharibacteria bacterium]